MSTDETRTLAALRDAAAAVPPAGRDLVADAVRGGERRRVRRRTTRAAVASGLGVGLAVAAVVLGTGVLPAGPGRALAPSGPDAPGATAEELLALLDRPATAEDQLPAALVDSDDGGLSPSSARLVADDGTTAFYAGTGDEGEVCVLVLFGSGTSGSSCAPPAVFARQGVWLSLQDASLGRAAGLLVPDGATEADVERMTAAVGGGGTTLTPEDRLAPNLVARTRASGTPGGGPAGPDLLAVLAEPAGPEDAVTSEALGGEPGSGIGPWERARRLPDLAGAQAWVTDDPSQDMLCLLVVPDGAGNGPTTCRTSGILAEEGMTLGVDRPDGSLLTVLLVPDGWDPAAGPGERELLDGLGLSTADRVGPNLFARDDAPPT